MQKRHFTITRATASVSLLSAFLMIQPAHAGLLGGGMGGANIGGALSGNGFGRGAGLDGSASGNAAGALRANRPAVAGTESQATGAAKSTAATVKPGRIEGSAGGEGMVSNGSRAIGAGGSTEAAAAVR